MADSGRVRVELDGVPETLLWTLYHRVVEARQPNPVIEDPRAVELLDALDYPFEERFGPANAVVAQGQGLRVRTFDEQIRRFLAAYPDGTVVALGEGLETQYWRVDNGRMHWLTVDLPATVELRERVLPAPPRARVIAGSALDERWLDEVDPRRGVLVTAEGLLMYLPPEEVRGLVARCAQRLPGGGLLFDAVPRWFSAATQRGAMKTSTGFEAPPMPWGLDAHSEAVIRSMHPNIAAVHQVPLPAGRGFFYRCLVPYADLVPVVRRWFPSITLVRFGPG